MPFHIHVTVDTHTELLLLLAMLRSALSVNDQALAELTQLLKVSTDAEAKAVADATPPSA